ncbi:MAG: cbb3-type cytochrome oxidase assembly protein CcoS [Gammaproteobacteria bacterium]|nr:cbb3-type cytochrome oxidase assembly protein CcoS [Gammaproteobacteria bacterium]
MSVIYALIPLSIMLLALAIWAFRWAVKSKQFDDLDRSARDILFDDDEDLHQRAILADRGRSKSTTESSSDAQ